MYIQFNVILLKNCNYRISAKMVRNMYSCKSQFKTWIRIFFEFKLSVINVKYILYV